MFKLSADTTSPTEDDKAYTDDSEGCTEPEQHTSIEGVVILGCHDLQPWMIRIEASSVGENVYIQVVKPLRSVETLEIAIMENRRVPMVIDMSISIQSPLGLEQGIR